MDEAAGKVCQACGAVRDEHGILAHKSKCEIWCSDAGKAADPVALTTDRRTTHGDWEAQSTLFDNLMWQLTHSKNWDQMGPMKRGALINIAQKMSRICTGDFDEPDHFHDIGGYALLGNGGHKR